MDFVEILPVELVEEILIFLSSDDIINCSLVSWKWREIINSNQLWAKVCSKELNSKDELDVNKSYLINPRKHFRRAKNKCDRLSNTCYWRNFFDSHKFLERNWKRGIFACYTINIRLRPLFSDVDQGILVVEWKNNEGFIFLSIVELNLNSEINIFSTKQRERISNLIIKRDLIIFYQRKSVIAIKDFKKLAFNVELERQNGYSNEDNEVRMARAGDLLYAVYENCPAKISVVNVKKGQRERSISWIGRDRSGANNSVCTCFVINNNKLYAAINKKRDENVIYEYDLINKEWVNEVSVMGKVTKMYFCDNNILVAVLEVSNNPIDCQIYAFSLQHMRKVSSFKINGSMPLLVTKNAIFHCQTNIIIIQGLSPGLESEVSKFSIDGDIVLNLFAISDSLLVVNSGNTLNVYNWYTGELLYTTYRGIATSNMWADNQRIVLNKFLSEFRIIAFW